MTALVHFLGLLSSFTLAATDFGELVFQDDFERYESQEKKDEPGRMHFNGHWAVEVMSNGKYQFEVRRWPKESGLKILEGTPSNPPKPGCLPSFSAVPGVALPIKSATLRINGKNLQTKQISLNDSAIIFTQTLNKGLHEISPFFSIFIDGIEQQLGCYYLHITHIN